MNIFITGASGFVGTALTKALHADGHNVISLIRDWTRMPTIGTVVRGDIRDADMCRRVIAEHNIDTIYHLAAQSIVSVCAEDPVTALDVAVLGTARLLQAVRESGRPIKICVSTSDKSFGAAKSPYTEDTPLDPRNSYDASKACQDIVARMFYHNYGVDVKVVRACNIYGPNDPNESRLIPSTIIRMLKGEPARVHAGASEMKRQYVYIADLVKALRIVCDKGKAGEAYCVGSPDDPLKVTEVIGEIASQLGRYEIEQSETRDARFQEIQEQSVKDGKIRALGWKPVVAFEEGIKRTIEWYRSMK